MWKYLTALMLLLAVGVVGAQLTLPVEECTDCYANIITQYDTQTIENVRLGGSDVDVEKVGVGNEGLSAAIIVTPELVEPTQDGMFAVAGFARIDQKMDQKISGLGSYDPEMLAEGAIGAKGLTWNKAIQAAWIANQGIKEKEFNEDGTTFTWVKEGAYIAQTTIQNTSNILDYDSREEAKILNVDNKLAMIVDDIETIINLTATADSATTDSQESTGNVYNDVNITVDASDSAYS